MSTWQRGGYHEKKGTLNHSYQHRGKQCIMMYDDVLNQNRLTIINEDNILRIKSRIKIPTQQKKLSKDKFDDQQKTLDKIQKNINTQLAAQSAQERLGYEKTQIKAPV